MHACCSCILFNFRVLAPVDCLAIGYFMTSLLSPSNSPNVVNNHFLPWTLITNYSLELLLSELSKYPIKAVSTVEAGKVTLQLHESISKHKLHITGQGAMYLVTDLKQSSAISELVINNACLSQVETILQSDEDGLLQMAKALQTNSFLTKISLNCSIQNRMAVLLLKCLK